MRATGVPGSNGPHGSCTVLARDMLANWLRARVLLAFCGTAVAACKDQQRAGIRGGNLAQSRMRRAGCETT